MIGVNDGFPQLPRHHPLRRFHQNMTNNNNNYRSSPKNCLNNQNNKSCGITLKPLYENRRHHYAQEGMSPPSQNSIYPYQLPRLSPIERQKIYYSGKSFPGGAHVFVNDTWMVVPLEALNTFSDSPLHPMHPPSYRLRTSSLNGSHIQGTVSSRSTSCDGCRRNSCPPEKNLSSSDEEKSSTGSDKIPTERKQENRQSDATDDMSTLRKDVSDTKL